MLNVVILNFGIKKFLNQKNHFDYFQNIKNNKSNLSC